MKTNHLSHLLAAFGTALFVTGGLWVLWNGHLPDDALILFTYVDNLAAGHGIVYRPGAGPAEGATDFLWLLALSGLAAGGLDVALAALLLNGAGAYLVMFLVMRRGLPAQPGRGALAGALALLLVVTIAQPAQASLGGFSAFLYGGLCLLLWEIGIATQRSRLLWLPALGLLLGLIRPDGVIVGVVAALAGLLRLWRDPLRGRYLAVIAACTVIGLGYFTWRYSYFGLPLPLPLYVKTSENAFMPGMTDTVLWFAFNAPLFVIAAFGRQWMNLTRRQYLLAWMPFLALICLLAFVHQSQNIAFRFQVPATVVLLYVFAAYIGGSFGAAAHVSRRIAAAILLVTLAGLYGWTGAHGVRLLTSHEYANPFTARLDALVGPETSVAVTEAGRTAFWTDGNVTDLIGLNTVATARNEADADYLQQLDPDLLVVFTGHILDVPAALAGTSPVLEVDAETLSTWVSPEMRQRDRRMLVRTDRVPLASVEYLRRNPDRYRIFLVWYFGWYKHMYAVRTDAIDADEVLAQLRASLEPGNFRSYAALRFAD